MGFLAMAGFDANDTMAALPGTLDLAAAGAIDLGDAADIASNILTGYGMEADEIGRMNDVLAKTFTSTNVDMRMLGDSFKYIAPVANSAGLEFEEMSAAVGLLGNAGIQGEQAGTVLRGAISSLLQPTSQVQDKLDELGVSVTDSGGNMRSLTDIIEQLEESGADTADIMTLFGLEAGPGMAALLDQGSDSLSDLTAELEDSGGTAAEVAEIQSEGLNGSLTELKSAVEGLALALADSGLLEWVTSLTERVTGWVQKLSETNPQMLKWAVIIGGVAAAIGPLLVVVGTLITSVGKIATAIRVMSTAFRIAAIAKALFSAALWASPITWIVIGIIALIAAIVLLIVYWDDVKAAVGIAWDWIVDKLASAWEWIKNTASDVWEGIKNFFSNLWESIKNTVASAWDWVVEKISSAWSSAQSFVSSGVSKVLGFIQRLAQIPGRVGQFFRDMVSAAANRISDLLSRVREIPGKVKSAVGNLGSLLLNAGKNIIRGLINGITSMVGKLRGKLSEITSKITDWKGPMRVDRVLLAPTGKAIMGGLVEGVEDGVPGLRKSLQGVTNEIPHNVNARVRHSGGGERDRVVVDVTGADQELVRLIRKMVRVQGRGDVQTAFGR